MTYGFTYVPHGRINLVLPQLLPYLYKSEFWTKSRANVDDLIGFLYSGVMHLWCIYEEEEPKRIVGYVITEIKHYPKQKMLVWQYGSGDTGVMEKVDDLVVGTIEKFAIDAKCDGIEIIGRPGWRRQAKKYGFESPGVIYDKFFNPAK